MGRWAACRYDRITLGTRRGWMPHRQDLGGGVAMTLSRPKGARSRAQRARRSTALPWSMAASGRRRQAGGFALLEAIVAIVLFAAAGMALYGLFNTNLISLLRVHDVSREAPVVRYAMEHLSAVDPRAEAGSFEVDGFDVTWTARLVEPVRQGQNVLGVLGDFEVGLYDIEFQVADDGRRLGTWRLRRVGFEKVRGFAPEGFLF